MTKGNPSKRSSQNDDDTQISASAVMSGLLVDTNVWLDYYLGRQPGCSHASLLISSAIEQNVILYVTSLSLKDVFFLIRASLKADARRDGGKLTENVSTAITETTWACLRDLMSKASVVSIGIREALGAFTLKPQHDDFEDDLIISSMESCGIGYLVTQDATLRRRFADTCLSPREACKRIV